MKIATKTLASLLIITMLTLSSTTLAGATSRADGNHRQETRLERLTKRHDRKMELQASILGITPEQLKEELKTASFDQVLKKYGFKTREDFRMATAGKIKDELKKRGWSDEKIQKLLDKRLSRLESKTNS